MLESVVDAVARTNTDSEPYAAVFISGRFWYETSQENCL